MAKAAPGTSPLPPLSIRAQLRWDVVRPLIVSVAPASIIEVGAGQGAMGAHIASMTGGSYVAYEIDELSYLQAKARIERVGGEVYNSTVEAGDPAPADLLCAFEVLEHIEDDVAAMAAWSRFVKPGGRLVMSVPANPDRFGPMDEHAGHFRRYTPEGLRSVVEGAGFVDVTSRLYGSPLGYGLEAVRNRIDAKKLARTAEPTPERLTAASGRTFQFESRSWKSTLASAGTTPFRYLQRVCPGGIGLVLIARKPVA